MGLALPPYPRERAALGEGHSGSRLPAVPRCRVEEASGSGPGPGELALLRVRRAAETLLSSPLLRNRFCLEDILRIVTFHCDSLPQLRFLLVRKLAEWRMPVGTVVKCK